MSEKGVDDTRSMVQRWVGRDWRPDIWLSYAFATGTSLLLFIAIAKQEGIAYLESIDRVGIIPLLFILLAVGALAHSIYRRVLGEVVYYPVQQILHFLLTCLIMPDSSVIGFFLRRKVSLFKTRVAYIAIRRWMRERGEGIEDINRAELHILYLSATFIFTYAAILWVRNLEGALSWLAVGGAVLLAAMFADSQQHARELRHFKIINKSDEDKISELLKELGVSRAGVTSET